MIARFLQLWRAVLSISIKGPEDDVTLCKAAITDITQHKEMEEIIRRPGAFLQTVVDAIPEVLLVIGADYRIVLANRAAREMAGGIDPTVGLACHQLLHHRDLPCAGKDQPCPLSLVITNKVPVAVTHTHYDAEGKESFIEVSAAPVFNETGEVSCIIEACRDITERMRLERALRLTQFSVDRAGDAVFWLGPDAKFFYANARALQHLGYSREEMLSMTVHDVDPNFPAEVWQKHWEELKRRGVFTFESQLRTKDGGLVPVEITVNYLEFEGKEYNCAFVRDITARNRMEERLARLNSVKEQLLGPSDLGEKLKLITDAVVEVFGADFARIWLLDAGDLCERGCRHATVTEGPDVCRDRSQCLHLVASSGRYTAIDGSHRRVPVGCYKIGRIASGEEPTFVTNDVTHDPRVHDRGWAASLGLVSFAGYRLLSPKGTPLGVLALFSKRKIDADENTLLEDLANTAAQVIRTGRAEESLRREKAFADIVIDSIPGVFYVLDGQRRFVRWNQLFEKVTGLTAEMLRGTDALLAIFADDRELVASKIREVFEQGQAQMEARFLAKDGIREFWFTGRRMDVGPISYLVGSGIDITDRKQAEESLQKAHDELEDKVQRRTAELATANEKLVVLNAIAETVSRSLDLQGIIDSALERILDLLKAKTGWIYLKDGQTGCLALSACRGFLATSPQEDEAALPKDCSCQQAMDDGTVHVLHAGPICLHGDPQALAHEGLRCHINIPLKANDKVLGVMNLAYGEDRDFPSDEIQIMTSIGHQIGMAVENARLYKDLLGKEVTGQYLLDKLISAHEVERSRIARELHDEAGQSLTALLLQLADAEAMLPVDAEQVKLQLAELQILTASIVEEIRRLMQDLRPSLLDDQGLIPAIQSYARMQRERSGVKFQIDVQGGKRKLPASMEIALFRIFQEAITNIAKHAHAENGRIELQFKDSSLEAQITDDGCGFDPVSSRTTWQTFGLLGMEERVAILGGTLRIVSHEGRGTKIHLTVPTPPSAVVTP